MNLTLLTFPALYCATILMLTGNGLFFSFIGLRLTSDGVEELWIGGLTAAYYAGMVCGAKFGHQMIAAVGHIRSYVACAGAATMIVLLHVLFEDLWLWLTLRFITGLVMMNQYMVIESWLNEQADNNQRGAVFAGYMVAVSLGLILGQSVLIWRPELDFKPLLIVALCFAACLLPVALTRRLHPAKLVAAPLQIRFFWRRVPQALSTVFITGLMVGSFYALAPVFITLSGLDTAQSSTFVAVAIFAGLCGQWPIGWLSDRIDRSRLIRACAVTLCLVSIPLWGLFDLSFTLLLLFGFLSGLLLFTLYPLAVALANDNIEQPQRVALSAMLLATHGVGACLGPLLCGALMNLYGHNAFYMVFSLCALLLIWRVQPSRVTREFLVEGAPLQHVAMPEHPISVLAATLDPRVDEVPEELVINEGAMGETAR
ncbi:MFS transporter [Pseudomonas protegens]|uniref:MFS transporter n=1 Tax=Pseudomonas protegens TaxID=380021 RepID=UPI000F4C8EF7|nr:MFS transporter [Pseudomonas protegens]ROL80481.1 MFS transporter [Pseudomonas protegens]